MTFSVAGAVDLHVHCGPEGIPRRFDAVQLAQHVKEAGLRSAVLKSHFGSTSGWAQMAHRLTGVRLCGSVTLNHHVGGINPDAVRAALGPSDEQGPFLRVVWLPTIHAAAHLAARHAEGEAFDVPAEWAGGGVVPLVAQRIDRLRPISLFAEDVQHGLDAVLDLVARHRLVLATGHIGRDEIFHVVDRARAAGVERIVITHVQYDPPALGHRDLEALAAQEVYIELSYVLIEMGMVAARESARLLRLAGAARTVLTSDLGQVHMPTPAEGLARFAELLIQKGLVCDEIETALIRNPRRLVDL